MKNKQAITFGRFNYLSNGHLEFFRSVLKRWNKLTILVLKQCNPKCNLLSPKNTFFNDFYNECDSHFNIQLTPISIRLNAFHHIGSLDVKNINAYIFDRPELVPYKFNYFYPKEHFNLVFSKDKNKSFDVNRFKAFKKILNRNIYEVHPNMFIHNSDMNNTDKSKNFDPDILKFYKYNHINLKK